MKLEQIHNSKYYFDSLVYLGEPTFHVHFREQINNDVFDKLLDYFMNDIRIASCSLSISSILDSMRECEVLISAHPY
jgi:hypothetical protein